MSKKIVVLGAGTAGTIVSNNLRRHLPADWEITIIDRDDNHLYQPGLLFVPFGIQKSSTLVKSRKKYITPGINFVIDEITHIDPDKKQVKTRNHQFDYDFLVISTGCRINPEENDGMMDAWGKNVFTFYYLEMADMLRQKLSEFQGGKIVMNIAEMPIKCPVAPIEFVFLADWYAKSKGIRNKTEIELVTPLPGAFTKPKASEILGGMLDKKNIRLTPDFGIASIDNEGEKIVSFDEKEIEFDVLVTVPTNMGDDYVERSGMGDELNFIPTDQSTLQSKEHENIYVIGDATDLPSSKAGSVAHFQADILMENFLDAIEGRKPEASFDGHANCFIESGFGKGILIDFNYDTEPLPGKFPLPGIGPFSLLEETQMNHYGKVMFRWVYWNLLLRGLELPIESHMTMAGKRA